MPSDAPDIEAVFNSKRPEHPPITGLLFDVTLRNHSDQPRWFLLPSKFSPVPEEMGDDGVFEVTKHEGTGGLVNLKTVKEQLVYEMGDPAEYISPDVVARFDTLQLEQVGENRVRVTGARGLPRPPMFKVSMAYDDGWKAQGHLLVCGPEAVAMLHFPGLDPDAARWLVANRAIKSIGLDTPSIDFGQSTHFESHQVLFAEEIPAFENLANLDLLPATGFVVIALPMKIAGGSGGPLRIVAIVP